jgi:hypothetical protein
MRRFGRVAVIALLCTLATSCSGESASTQAPAPATSAAPHTTAAAKAKHHRHASRKAKRRRGRPAPPRGVPAADVPNPRLTPGAVLSTSAARICRPGYSASVRDVPYSVKLAVYARYGVPYVAYEHEVDHLVSLEVGGSNAITNLWPEPYAGRWGARTKDVLENALHDLVCSGRLSLPHAQRIEARNWVKAYRLYVGGTPTATAGPSSGGSGAGGSSAGGYYASSYPSATTIYCADDTEWRSLSKAYLVHVKTFAQAIARFPGRHLHQPC